MYKKHFYDKNSEDIQKSKLNFIINDRNRVSVYKCRNSRNW